MGRCKNDKILNKIGLDKINKLMEIDLAVLTDADSCVKANTRNYIATEGNTVSFNQYKVPADLFNCLAEGCRNSGTLMVGGGVGESVSMTINIPSDATEYFAGLITQYVYLAAKDGYTIETTIADLKDTNFTNADVYTQKLKATEERHYPVIVDLTQAPTSQEGNGWEASENGIIMKVSVKPDTATTVSNVGFSSIYVYDSIEDFETNDVVKVGCLTEVGDELSIDPVDASCFGGGYDPDSIAISKTINGKSITANNWKVNPLLSRGELTKGWYIHSEEREVVESTFDGRKYGLVQVADMNMDECAFTTAQISDNCNVTDAELQRLNTPVVLVVNERQYIVLDGTTTDINDAGKIIFHESLIGQKVIVSYPKEVEAEHFVANDQALETRRVRMTFTREQTDGVKIQYIYNNVLVTSFPEVLNNEEANFEIGLSIQRARNGNFFEKFRIRD
ncbi:hypothetical protein NRIC_03930 [Enterococcus florum]|uniref:Uncharacterized protein n=1 Tax=Enterococcus florum TaxID=2480627 RepID=A0A4P5PAI0_9ENTE|nr:hypothetical protein [Enterococcus florum]GCF92502.1 hypothetical protein NRIC_03930 [Enterococcus florum]